MKLVATSTQRWRASASERRLYGGSTVTKFIVYRAEDRNDASKWVAVVGYGPTPGQRKTDALNKARRLLEPAALALNPAPDITPLGWFALAGIAVATIALWASSKKASAATPACPIDVPKLHQWGIARDKIVVQLPGATAAPALTTIPNLAPLELQSDVVVVLQDGSFWKYPDDAPVAAPELRSDYCAFTS